LERHNAGRSTSTDRQALSSNSDVSEGWQVRCKCGARTDDGEAMAECEGGCKTWVHMRCHKLKLGDDFYCDKCSDDVQTSKACSELDDPMDEPQHLEGDAGSDADVVVALVSRKSGAAGSSPAAQNVSTPAGHSLTKGTQPTRAASNGPAASAEEAGQDPSPAKSIDGKSKKKKSKKVST